MKSILQNWVMELGLRHQGVLITFTRGCDGVIKEDKTKFLAREIRGLFLVPFDERELNYNKGFMVGFPNEIASNTFPYLLCELDSYPVHYLFHLIHATEIIGYKHPEMGVRVVYLDRYQNMVKRLHLNPETEKQLDSRLNQDRILNETVEA